MASRMSMLNFFLTGAFTEPFKCGLNFSLIGQFNQPKYVSSRYLLVFLVVKIKKQTIVAQAFFSLGTTFSHALKGMTTIAILVPCTFLRKATSVSAVAGLKE